MKKLKFLVLLFVAVSVGFAGCKKGDDDDDAKVNIVGKWTLTREVEKFYVGGQFVDESIEDDYDNDDWVLEFKNDGTYKGYDEGDLDEQGTYSIQEDGKKLVLDETNGADDIFTINKLTSSELVLYFEETEGSGSQAQKYTYEETYKKQ